MRDDDAGFLAHVTERLAALPHVEAVALGGSRAMGTHRPDSDWDLAVYYRDLDEVEHHLAEANEGSFRIERLLFHLVGVPTYIVVAELAVNQVVHGTLPRPAYPDAWEGSSADRRDPSLDRW